MKMLKNALHSGKKKVVKHQVKKLINDKLKLDGEYDEKVEQLADKAVDKIGVDNLIKAKKVIDALKN